jgi:hypothetical protein
MDVLPQTKIIRALFFRHAQRCADTLNIGQFSKQSMLVGIRPKSFLDPLQSLV